MSKLTDFLRGEGTAEGRALEQIISMSDAALEFAHNWVQWAFPLQTASNFNAEAPLLTNDEILIVRADPIIGDNFDRLCCRYLRFLGLIEEDSKVVVGSNFHERCRAVWGSFNHNYLRVTRLLESMRLFGKHEKSAALFNCLKELSVAGRIASSDNAMIYWSKTQEKHDQGCDTNRPTATSSSG